MAYANTFVTYRGLDCLVVPNVSKTKMKRVRAHVKKYSMLLDVHADAMSPGRHVLYFPVLAAGRDATAQAVNSLLNLA
jgi:hypothetical protein